MVNILFSFVLLLGNCSGCGGGGKPERPEVGQDPALVAAQTKLLGQGSSLLDIPYGEYVQRFTPSAVSTGARQDALGMYQGLIGKEDYGLENFEQTESDYLESVLGRFKQTREEQFEPLKERLIAENLYESGPGFGQEREFLEETALGEADIAAKLGYEGLQRKYQERSYQDALQRGDYTTMFNLALKSEAADILPEQLATETQLGTLGTVSGLTGQIGSQDLQQQGLEQQAYENELADYYKNRKNLGGLGSSLGALGGLGLAAVSTMIPGGWAVSPLVGGAIGGIAGGGLGSMFEY